ncbi:MAG TPA: hypothetical protein VFQ65_02625 [Kofleriaceae bacterium]|nr:hypothetical protein [Kofleriaceae bacterium]
MRLAWFGLTVSLLAACVASSASDNADSTSQAPLIGVNGSSDQADHSCNVVLRGLERSGNGTGGYATNGESWIWTGAIEISNAAATEGLAPSALYQSGSDASWHEVPALPSSQPATPGFTRFDVKLDQGLPGPGMSGTSLANSKV